MLPISKLAAIIAAANTSAFPITGLSPAVQNALRLYIPSPNYCFSDASGVVQTTQDGLVQVWKDSLNKGLNISTATTSYQPRLRKGTKNFVVNSDMSGAAVGTPGTQPTGWNYGSNGMNSSMIATGNTTIGGISFPYIDVRFWGTPSTQVDMVIEPANTTNVVVGQQWTNSVYLAYVASPAPAAIVGVHVIERNSSGSFLVSSTNSVSLTTTLTRFSVTRTLSSGTVTQIGFGIRSTMYPGQYYDFTLRIAAPQTEFGSGPSAITKTGPIQTSNGVGNWWLDFDGIDDRMGFGGQYVLPVTDTQHFASMGLISNRASGLTQIPFNTGGAGTQRWGTLALTPSPNFSSQIWRDDAGTQAVLNHTTPGTARTPLMMSARKDGANYRGRSNASIQTATATLGTLTPTTPTIGSGGSISFFEGGIYSFAVGTGVAPTDAEMLQIEKYVGNTVGVTIS